MKLVMATSIAVLAANAAMAGAPIFVPAPLPPIIAAPVQDWSGLYVGAQVGYGMATMDDPGFVFGDTVLGDLEASGFLYGVHLGYNFDLGSIVLGAEIDYNIADMPFDLIPNATYTELSHLKARVGYDLGSALVYGAAGLAHTTIDSAGTEIDDTGYFVGVGADYRISNDWTVGAEYLYHQFDDFNDSSLDIQMSTIHARVSYHF